MPFCSVQVFAQVVEDGTIADFNTLGIIGREESVGGLIRSVKAGHLLAGKVRPVVRDDGVEELEMTHYVLPEKLDNLLLSDF